MDPSKINSVADWPVPSPGKTSNLFGGLLTSIDDKLEDSGPFLLPSLPSRDLNADSPRRPSSLAQILLNLVLDVGAFNAGVGVVLSQHSPCDKKPAPSTPISCLLLRGIIMSRSYWLLKRIHTTGEGHFFSVHSYFFPLTPYLSSPLPLSNSLPPPTENHCIYW